MFGLDILYSIQTHQFLLPYENNNYEIEMFQEATKSTKSKISMPLK